MSLAETSVNRIRTKPLTDTFGVEISGIDLATADADTLRTVVDILRQNGVMVVRDQNLSPDEQVRFTRLFGEPAENVREEFTVPGHPEVFVISNKVVDGRKIGDLDAGSGWHSDMRHMERTADVTILHALEVPTTGSDTLFADQCAAWNALAPEQRTFLDGKQILNSYHQLSLRKGFTLTPEQLAKVPEVWHPVVRHHPVDGRKALFLAIGSFKSMTGVSDDDEGYKLVKELMDFATQERFQYRHKWKVGDVLAWDNACTLHKGTPFDSKNEIRLVHRTWVRGERPH
jgi:taurine dioxygenase